jgi:hypothetical protein
MAMQTGTGELAPPKAGARRVSSRGPGDMTPSVVTALQQQCAVDSQGGASLGWRPLQGLYTSA